MPSQPHHPVRRAALATLGAAPRDGRARAGREIMIGRDAPKPRRISTVAPEDIRGRLTRLPRRAVVAFAARCARRVQPLAHALPQQDRDAIARAIASAEAFAQGTATADTAWAAARAADDAADEANAARAAAARAADNAARAATDADAAAWAAVWAADAAAAWVAAAARAAAARAATWVAAASDLERLIASNPGRPGTPGAPIDPSESGPLGPLWPHGVPEWYTEAATGTGTPHEEPSGDAD
jgi:hypothetical protein